MSLQKRGSILYLKIDSHTYCYDESEPILGEGAMGVVYRGYELETRKIVAIKRVKDKYSGYPEIRRRARLEASLMFSHPNLVEMYGCCEVAPDRGPLFIISGYVEGDNIDRFIDKNIRHLPNAEKRICNMFLPVLDALSYIHQKNIIHMDIKPSNIMVENERNVRLMDLGIADVSMATSDITSEMMGTPKYAAPEQFANTTVSSKLSRATDIYEAGVTLYELITKQNPFPNAVGEARLLHQSTILKKTPQISDQVLAVIQKATAIEPSKRYQHASEMKRALVEALREPPRKASTGFSWIYVSIVLVLLLIIIGILIIVYVI
jgi:serine/threonine-protein kinase